MSGIGETDTGVFKDVLTKATSWSSIWRDTFNMKDVGTDRPHNNIQPSRATYIWVRVS
nr:MAG TPA: Baseplate structural protein [Caudoviricetes sp.]